MDKYIKRIIVVIAVVCILGITFVLVYSTRAKEGKKPIFCIPVTTYRDGGTTEYLGLGYRVIQYNTFDGNYETKFGSWLMRYQKPTLRQDEKGEIISIEKLQENRLIEMYKVLLKHLILEDIALNEDAEFLSLDMKTFVRPFYEGEKEEDTYPPVSQEVINAVESYCYEFHNVIKQNSMEELKEQGYFDEETMSLSGVLVYMSEVEKIEEDNAVISVAKYRSGLGAIFPKYELTFKDGKWSLKVLEMAVS